MPYLRETLESVAAQTLQDFEVLAWDNGSTDGSVDELARWIPERLPGRLVHDRPLPLDQSLAALVECSSAQFCARIDADDIAEPHRLERQIAWLLERPAVAMAGSQISPIDEAGRPATLEYSLPLEYGGIQDRLLRANCFAHPSVVFRREAVLAVGNYRRPAPVEDYDLWLRLAARYTVVNLPEKLLRYRIRTASVVHDALRKGGMSQAVEQAWVENAAAFAGLSSERAAQLCRRQIRFLLPSAWRIATALGRRDGIRPAARLGCASFHHALRAYVHPGDYLMRAILRAGRGKLR